MIRPYRANTIRRATAAYILFLMVAAAMIAWQLAGSAWVDDWNYKLSPLSTESFWQMEGHQISNFDQALKAIAGHHHFTTPRLPNYLQTLANLLPDRLIRTLHGLMLAASFLMLAFSCGGYKVMRSVGFVATLWLTAWISLPLDNYMISSDFAFNYFWPSTFILLFVYLFTSDKFKSGRWRFLPWLVAFIAGTMHEGASLPIATGCISLIIIDKTDRRRRLALVAVMSVVALAFFFNQGMMDRISQHITDRDNTHLKWMIINLFIKCYGLYFAIASLLISLARKRLDGLKRFAADNVVWLTATAVATAIAFATMTRGRTLWFADLFGLILLFKSLYANVNYLRAPRYALAAVAGFMLLSSISASAILQRRLSAESDIVAARLSQDNSPVVFIDFTPPYEIPWWTFGVPQSISDGYQNSSISLFYKAKAPYALLLPAAFNGDDPQSWPKLPGNTGLSGQYPFLAGRERLNSDGTILLTFCRQPSAVKRLATEGPLSALLNGLRCDELCHTTAYTFSEWSIDYLGDTLWCYYIDTPRQLDANLIVTSFDTP